MTPKIYKMPVPDEGGQTPKPKSNPFDWLPFPWPWDWKNKMSK